MTLDEALIIAQSIEDDQVVGPVGQAIRVLLKAYLVESQFRESVYKSDSWDQG